MDCGLWVPAGCSVGSGRGNGIQGPSLVEHDIRLCLDGVF